MHTKIKKQNKNPGITALRGCLYESQDKKISSRVYKVGYIIPRTILVSRQASRPDTYITAP